MKIGAKVWAKSYYKGTIDRTFTSWRNKKYFMIKIDNLPGNCFLCCKRSDIKVRKDK